MGTRGMGWREERRSKNPRMYVWWGNGFSKNTMGQKWVGRGGKEDGMG